MQVVAEGVESVDQLEFLQAHGCDLLTGYLISKAVPVFEAIETVARHLEEQPLPVDVIV